MWRRDHTYIVTVFFFRFSCTADRLDGRNAVVMMKTTGKLVYYGTQAGLLLVLLLLLVKGTN